MAPASRVAPTHKLSLAVTIVPAAVVAAFRHNLRRRRIDDGTSLVGDDYVQETAFGRRHAVESDEGPVPNVRASANSTSSSLTNATNSGCWSECSYQLDGDGRVFFAGPSWPDLDVDVHAQGIEETLKPLLAESRELPAHEVRHV